MLKLNETIKTVENLQNDIAILEHQLDKTKLIKRMKSMVVGKNQKRKQAGAELCQAQDKLWRAGLCCSLVGLVGCRFSLVGSLW